MEKRDCTIDFIKGMLILGVVYGHTITALWSGHSHQPVWLHTFVRTYDMPFFMLLSGWFFRKSLARAGLVKSLVNHVTMLFVPIVVWSLLRGVLNVFGGLYYFVWAVLACGVVCAITDYCTSRLKGCARLAAQSLALTAVAVLLHLFAVPWNLFYLFPFFAVGFMAPRLRFSFRESVEAVLFVCLVVGLCFWKSQYTPWTTGGEAWKVDGFAFVVYAYRFALALLGVHFVWKVFDSLRQSLGEGSWLVSVVVRSGRESLSIYLLHMFPLRLIGKLCPQHPSFHGMEGLIGYVEAPMLAFVVVLGLLLFIRLVKSCRFTGWMLGFKAIVK